MGEWGSVGVVEGWTLLQGAVGGEMLTSRTIGEDAKSLTYLTLSWLSEVSLVVLLYVNTRCACALLVQIRLRLRIVHRLFTCVHRLLTRVHRL